MLIFGGVFFSIECLINHQKFKGWPLAESDSFAPWMRHGNLQVSNRTGYLSSAHSPPPRCGTLEPRHRRDLDESRTNVLVLGTPGTGGLSIWVFP